MRPPRPPRDRPLERPENQRRPFPYQRTSIYQQFEGDPSQGFQHRGIQNPPSTGTIGAFTGKGPRNYRRSDLRIYEEVCESLRKHPQLDASDIEVSVKNHIVTLSGTVRSRRMRALAEDLIEQVVGIDDIENLLGIFGRKEEPDRNSLVRDRAGRSNLRFGAAGSSRNPNISGS